MPHEDGGSYHPLVATVSLGSNIVLDVYEKRLSPSPSSFSPSSDTGVSSERHNDRRPPPPPHWRILQEPRSLLITTGSAYTDLLHGIAEVDVDEDLTADTVANWDGLGATTTAAIIQNGGRSERGVRTSLTYRDVLKVSRVGSRILGTGRGRG